MGQISSHFHVELFVRPNHAVVDHAFGTAAPDLIAKGVDLIQIGLTKGSGVHQQLGKLFQPFELRHSLERKGQLVFVHDVKDDHVMAPVAEVLQSLEDDFDLIEKVGDQDNESPATDLRHDRVQDRSQVGCFLGFALSQRS